MNNCTNCKHGDPPEACILGRPLGDAQADAAAKWLSLHADNNGDGPDPLPGHPPCPSWEAVGADKRAMA